MDSNIVLKLQENMSKEIWVNVRHLTKSRNFVEQSPITQEQNFVKNERGPGFINFNIVLKFQENPLEEIWDSVRH